MECWSWRRESLKLLGSNQSKLSSTIDEVMRSAALECARAYVVEFLNSVWKASQSERKVEKSTLSVSLMAQSSSLSSRSTTALKVSSSSSSSGSTTASLEMCEEVLVGLPCRKFEGL